MYYIGIDLGGTNIKVGVVNEKCQIIGTGKLKTNAGRSAEAVFDDMAQAARTAVANAKISMDEVCAVGMGSPGTVNNETGMIEFAGNLQFVQVSARKLLEERLGKPIYMDNDANCAALGEALAGAGRGLHTFVAVTLGTGIGSGVVIDGKIHNGYNYAAAEMGHIVICMDGEQCNCGRKGCWERYAAATGLIRQTQRAMQEHPESTMWKLAENNIEKVSGRTAFDAMRAGDPVGKAVVDQYLRYVGCGLVDIVNTFQPEMICIGGGISKEGETILAPLRQYIEAERFSKYAVKQTRLCCAELGNDAGIIGAAMLGRA